MGREILYSLQVLGEGAVTCNVWFMYTVHPRVFVYIAVLIKGHICNFKFSFMSSRSERMIT